MPEESPTAYGDVWDFLPGPVKYQRYTDGTILPHIEIAVRRNGQPYGYVECHMHRTKLAPHDSVGFTSRVGPETDSAGLQR